MIITPGLNIHRICMNNCVFLFEQEMRKKREEELEALQTKLCELNASIEHNEVEIKKSQAGIQQVSN